jgi:YgiT-type zinc finger domain-containing protein
VLQNETILLPSHAAAEVRAIAGFEQILKVMRKEVSSMTCDVCGQTSAKLRHISRVYGKGDDLLVIENIPMISCPDCGESYFTADTLHEIDPIKTNRQSFAKRPVGVASFTVLKEVV